MTDRLRDSLWLGFFGLILAAWAALYGMALGAGYDLRGRPGLWAETLAALCAGPEAGVAGFFGVFAMWATMGVAMMLPTLVPTLRCHDRLAPRLDRPRRGWAGLVAGYGAVWLGFAVLAAAVQVALSRAGLLDTAGRVGAGAQAALLVAAGLYQFSRFKQACQSACLAPMSFFLGRYRPGFRGGVRMGAELGVLCIGCCWAIMALAFAGGVMNLAFMGLATVFMVLEKLPQIGGALRRPAGGLLIAAGLLLAAATVLEGV